VGRARRTRPDRADGPGGVRRLRRRRDDLRAVVNEELAYGHLAVATALSVHCLATSCIAEFGSEAQRERWLPEMAAEGRPVGMFCLSEPHAGSNPAEMSTTAEYDPEADEYVLNGEKQWITNGQRGGVAIVFAKTDGDDERSITQFLVPADTEGSQSARRRRSSVCAPRTRPASPSTTVGSRPKTGSLRREGALGRLPDAHRRPDRNRVAGGRTRAGGLRRGEGVRRGARAVRRADRRHPDDPAHVRGDGD